MLKPGEPLKVGIKWVKAQISTVKRLRGWGFERSPFVVTFRLDYEDDVSSVSRSSRLLIKRIVGCLFWYSGWRSYAIGGEVVIWRQKQINWTRSAHWFREVKSVEFKTFCVSVVFLPTPGKYKQISCRGQAWFPVISLCIKVKSKCSLVFEIDIISTSLVAQYSYCSFTFIFAGWLDGLISDAQHTSLSLSLSLPRRKLGHFSDISLFWW